MGQESRDRLLKCRMTTCCGEAEASLDCWYEVVQGSELEQGDILHNYPVTRVYTVRAADDKPHVRVERRDVVILTQTCDVLKRTQASILVAETVDYETLCRESNDETVSSEGYRKKLITNTVVAMFLLHKHEADPRLAWSTVSFRNLHVCPTDDIRLFAHDHGPRLRLRSPYKEHLSQSFARFMMRVGLPRTTHEFAEYRPTLSPTEKTA
jgi:hypothetical protein